MADFTEINEEVANLTTVVESAVAAFNGVADKIDAAVKANDAGDNSQLASLSASVRSQASALAQAIATNTDAEDEEPLPPLPEPGGSTEG